MSITRRQFLGKAAGALSALAVPDVSQGANRESTQSLEDILHTQWDDNHNILNFISQNKEEFEQSAKKYDMHPQFLAAVYYFEKMEGNPLDTIANSAIFGTLLNNSIGDGNIKISTAQLVDGGRYSRLNIRKNLGYAHELTQTSSNIDYAAKILRHMLNRKKRFPDISAEELMKNPKAMALAATEYNKGYTLNPLEKAEPNLRGFKVIAALAENSPLYGIFGRGSKNEGRLMSQYLEANTDLIEKSIARYKKEFNNRNNQYAALAILGLVGIGTARWLYTYERDRRRHDNVKTSK